jgi:ABC-type glycerol-3-phosphate transport system substrate-binding protein
MKYLVLILAAAALTGCGKIDRMFASFTGDASKTCVDGVTYLQFTSGAAPQYTIDGKLVSCK